MPEAEPPKLCIICGKPAPYFTAEAEDYRDSVGELQHGPLEGKRYYCKEHLPHIHGEPFEDRLE